MLGRAENRTTNAWTHDRTQRVRQVIGGLVGAQYWMTNSGETWVAEAGFAVEGPLQWAATVLFEPQARAPGLRLGVDIDLPFDVRYLLTANVGLEASAFFSGDGFSRESKLPVMFLVKAGLGLYM